MDTYKEEVVGMRWKAPYPTPANGENDDEGVRRPQVRIKPNPTISTKL